MAIRSSMHEVGAMLLGQLLQADEGDRAGRVACGRGHEAIFVEYRTKVVQTVLGSLDDPSRLLPLRLLPGWGDPPRRRTRHRPVPPSPPGCDA